MIKLITDSAADIPSEEVREYGIRVMPIPITVDGAPYHEGVDFTSEEYYDILLAAKKIPTTAQITMMEFYAAFREEIDAGNENLICVTITAKGSGIYNAALLARQAVMEELPQGSPVTIDVVDSAAYTYVYGLAVVAAARAAKEGLSREDGAGHPPPGADRVPGVLRPDQPGLREEERAHHLHRRLRGGRCWASGPSWPSRTGRPPPSPRSGGTTRSSPPWRNISGKNASEDGRGFYILYAKDSELALDLKKTLEKTTGRKCLGLYRIGASVTTNAGPTVFGVIVPADHPIS